MADKDDAPEEEAKQNDKHNWGAADLEKASFNGLNGRNMKPLRHFSFWHQSNYFAHEVLFQVKEVVEDKDDLNMSSDALGKIMSHPQPVRQKIINIKKDDLEMIMNELELPKSVVERKLIEVNGDPMAAMKSFIGFDS
ncbi:hypothetical protein Y032_0756g2090 [Ancylostoma ceylanicum]|uniref:Nascent polypeptide-associated complex subunit alpha-like UBA domain-containing protein n=1 Tax=Ancylostoma ceylanicum TaxID=53326 RepID=A0A016WEA1_9BILA|nr:hypothetical protein Y032_0756g2090 [Ancylostoma ceylanicum]